MREVKYFTPLLPSFVILETSVQPGGLILCWGYMVDSIQFLAGRGGQDEDISPSWLPTRASSCNQTPPVISAFTIKPQMGFLPGIAVSLRLDFSIQEGSRAPLMSSAELVLFSNELSCLVSNWIPGVTPHGEHQSRGATVCTTEGFSGCLGIPYLVL